jgi:predicted dehydrogenase
VAFINLGFPSKVMANLTVSWADPNRERYLEIVGSKGTIVFDDLNEDQPIQIHRSKNSVNGDESPLARRTDLLREAQVTIPEIHREEPLRLLCREFMQSIATGTCPLSDGKFGREVVGILCRIQAGMQSAI